MSNVHAADAPPARGDFAAFLQPEAMLTPGVAGGVTMLITNAVSGVFPVPLSATGLAISALLCTLPLASAAPLWKRSVCYVLNTLIVFSMAMGTGTLAYEASKKRTNFALSDFSLISSAHAQAADTRYVDALQQIFASGNLSEADRANAIASLNARAQAESWFVPGGAPMPPSEDEGFFKKWTFQ
ncbi:MAG: hypothetical protein ACKVP5_13470 [Aestuariivirga sp.]